ncbi:MAG: hypothetical protein PHU14_01450 [Methylovulum sp.]|nr:hypothetical protein [Methylovulum sp.]
MKAIIIGDSHTAALKLGADILKGQEDWPSEYQVEVERLGGANSMVNPYFIDRGDYAEIINEKQAKNIQRLPFVEEGSQCAYYGFSGPLHASRLWRRQMNWPNFTPFAPKGNQAPISTGLLKHVVFQEQIYTMQLVELLKRVGIKLFVIEAPKPYRHHRILEKVSPDIISYIDRFYKNAMKDWLESKGVPIISIPSHCYDADGFMYDTFRNEALDDGLHASKEFGALMINEVIKFLKSQG